MKLALENWRNLTQGHRHAGVADGDNAPNDSDSNDLEPVEPSSPLNAVVTGALTAISIVGINSHGVEHERLDWAWPGVGLAWFASQARSDRARWKESIRHVALNSAPRFAVSSCCPVAALATPGSAAVNAK